MTPVRPTATMTLTATPGTLRAGSESTRLDFETLLIEEGPRSFWLAYTAPIERVMAEFHHFDKATKIPVRPWIIGECCDHIYPTCPAVQRTGRLDANDGNWRLGRYETVDDPHNILFLDPEWDNPNGDVCGWCFRVWRGRIRKAAA